MKDFDKEYCPVAQWQSAGLLILWSLVRPQPGQPVSIHS